MKPDVRGSERGASKQHVRTQQASRVVGRLASRLAAKRDGLRGRCVRQTLVVVVVGPGDLVRCLDYGRVSRLTLPSPSSLGGNPVASVATGGVPDVDGPVH